MLFICNMLAGLAVAAYVGYRIGMRRGLHDGRCQVLKEDLMRQDALSSRDQVMDKLLDKEIFTHGVN